MRTVARKLSGSLAAAGWLAVAAAACAPGAARAAEPSPYVSFVERDIKALSPEQISQYLDGQGMGLALPAELNGYPGPRHVLDLGDELGLGSEQKDRVQQIYTDMHERAVSLGLGVVGAEAELDSLFAASSMDEATLQDRLARIADLQGELRLAHLRAHLETRSVLTPEQVKRYAQLRGYDESMDVHDHHHHGGHQGH